MERFNHQASADRPSLRDAANLKERASGVHRGPLHATMMGGKDGAASLPRSRAREGGRERAN